MNRGEKLIRYSDDVVVTVPIKYNIQHDSYRLTTGKTIYFTTDVKSNEQIPFLETLIKKSRNELKANPKPTIKGDLSHNF